MKKLIGFLLVISFLFITACSSVPINFKGLHDRILKNKESEQVETKKQETKDQITLRPIYNNEKEK